MSDLTIMNHKLGHTGWQKGQQIKKVSTTNCEICTVTKLHRGTRNGKRAHAHQLGEVINTDVCGKLHYPQGAEEWVAFADEFHASRRRPQATYQKAFDEYLVLRTRLWKTVHHRPLRRRT
mmetsp:Transcript_23227/g.33298  ORF Transcript_23227/g.33298 Transcript_23227/m.33298 type:complete len:120 (-) Transcript_23227:1183-1542(-)